MKRRTYDVIGLLLALAACSASGVSGQGDGDTRGDGSPGADAGADGDALQPPKTELDAARPLVCGDAGFCETRLPTSDRGMPLSLRRVWAVGPNDVWSVTLEGFVLHYDGTSWTTQYRANHELYAVWATPTSVWAGGEAGALLHRNAVGEWSRLERGHVAPIRAIYGTADDDVWITNHGNSIDHFDGATLTKHAVDVAGLEITTLFGGPGLGTFAAGHVRGSLSVDDMLPNTEYDVPDRPYVFELSSSNITVFNTSLASGRSFMPVSGAVSDTPGGGRRVVLIGYRRKREKLLSGALVATPVLTYSFVGSDGGVVADNLYYAADNGERLVPDWGPATLLYAADDIRFFTNLGWIVRWDGTGPESGFSFESLAMGYTVPSTTIFGAHMHEGDVWAVGDGFALKGSTRP